MLDKRKIHWFIDCMVQVNSFYSCRENGESINKSWQQPFMDEVVNLFYSTWNNKEGNKDNQITDKTLWYGLLNFLIQKEEIWTPEDIASREKIPIRYRIDRDTIKTYFNVVESYRSVKISPFYISETDKNTNASLSDMESYINHNLGLYDSCSYHIGKYILENFPYSTSGFYLHRDFPSQKIVRICITGNIPASILSNKLKYGQPYPMDEKMWIDIGKPIPSDDDGDQYIYSHIGIEVEDGDVIKSLSSLTRLRGEGIWNKIKDRIIKGLDEVIEESKVDIGVREKDCRDYMENYLAAIKNRSSQVTQLEKFKEDIKNISVVEYYIKND